MSDYHARIMNIPCKKRGLYAQGHRYARHAAAEIAVEAEAEVERLTVRDDAGNPVDANALARNLLALLDEARSEVERLRADRKILFALRNAAEHVWDITIDDPDNTDAVLELLAKPLDDAKKVFDRVIAETDARAALAGEEGGE